MSDLQKINDSTTTTTFQRRCFQLIFGPQACNKVVYKKVLQISPHTRSYVWPPWRMRAVVSVVAFRAKVVGSNPPMVIHTPCRNPRLAPGYLANVRYIYAYHLSESGSNKFYHLSESGSNKFYHLSESGSNKFYYLSESGSNKFYHLSESGSNKFYHLSESRSNKFDLKFADFG